MAKKPRSFAEKVAAATASKGIQCPECGDTYQYVQKVTSVQNEDTGSWKFNQKVTGVCKCNRAEVIG